MFTQAEQEWESVEDEKRTLRLMLLLEKSQIYCDFLLKKMEKQKVEAEKKQEKLEKKRNKEKDGVQMVVLKKKSKALLFFYFYIFPISISASITVLGICSNFKEWSGFSVSYGVFGKVHEIDGWGLESFLGGSQGIFPIKKIYLKCMGS